MNLEDLTDEDAGRYFDLYMNECEQRNEQGSLKDFTIWFEEKYGEQ